MNTSVSVTADLSPRSDVTFPMPQKVSIVVFQVFLQVANFSTAGSLYSPAPAIIAAFPSLISSFSHARVSCKLAAVYRVHRAPRVYGVSCRLTPGKPPGRRADGGRWGGGIGLGEELEREERETADVRSIHIFSAFERDGITYACHCLSARINSSPLQRRIVEERLVASKSTENNGFFFRAKKNLSSSS